MTAIEEQPPSYDGNVEVNGPPQVRDLGPLRIVKIAVGAMNNNAYFLQCAVTGDIVLIDAAAEPDVLLTCLNAFNAEPKLTAIITTHQHWDHWQALPEVIAATGAPVIAHPLDAEPLPVLSVQKVEDGDSIAVGASTLTVIHLVGHTPGSIALVYDGPDRPHIFTGDCLFPGGVGNTDKDPIRFTSLFEGVEQKVFGRLPDETWVYPGHGGDTTLGAERPQLEEWKLRGW